MDEQKTHKHVGEMLAKYAKAKRIYKAAWSRHQGIRKDTVTGYFKKQTMQTNTLFDICYVLKYNFFADLAASLPAEFPHEANALNEKLAALEKENEKLKTENELLKGLLGRG